MCISSFSQFDYRNLEHNLATQLDSRPESLHVYSDTSVRVFTILIGLIFLITRVRFKLSAKKTTKKNPQKTQNKYRK